MPKSFAFAVMPFREDFDDVYQLGIKGACAEVDAYCERVDEQMFEGTIIDRIYNQISKADVVISELTARSANVFYETGYAHGLGKRVILLAQSENDISLDLGQYAHVIYGDSISRLKTELTKRLRWAFENPKDNPAQAEFVLQLYATGKPLESTPVVEVPMLPGDSGGGDGFVFRLDLHNPTERPFSRKLGVGVVVEALDTSESDAKVVTLPDGRFLHLVEPDISVHPACWDSLEWILRDRKHYYNYGTDFDIEVVIYAEFGTVRYPLRVKAGRA